MNTTKRILSILGATGAAAMLGVLPAATPALAADNFGCPQGYVCVYPDASFNHAPILEFYTYGAHNLSNQYGVKRVYNNQTDGAIARTCTGYNGTGDCQGKMGAGYYVDKDLTLINSIVLAAS